MKRYQRIFKEVSKFQEGYTHYWKIGRDCDQAAYAQALEEIAKVAEAEKDILAGPNGEGEPVTDDGIIFNGIGDESHEDFHLPSNSNELRSFNFTKTAEKNYDKVVTASLSILKHFCPGIEVNSDGNREEWEEGVRIAKNVTGLDISNPIPDEERY